MKAIRLLLLAALACLAVGGVCRKPEEHLEPVDVSKTNGRAEYPSIAVGPDGNAYLAWSEANSDTDEQGRPINTEDVRLAVKPQGGDWSEPTKLTPGSPPARYPSIAVDKNNVLHVAWQQWVHPGEPGYWAVLYMRRASGDTWTAPDTISMYHVSTSPTLAVDQDAGRVHLYWNEEFSPFKGYTCYACKPSGGIWQDFQSFPFTDTMVPSDLEMRTDRQGRLHIVQGFGGKTYHLERGSGGQWEPLSRLSTNATGMGAYWPTFAVSADGGLRVVWTDDDTAYRGFACRQRDSAGSWHPIQGPFRRVWKQSFWGTTNAAFVRCVGDPQERLHVFWQGVDKLGYAVLARDTWSQMRVLAESIGVGGTSTIAASPDGSIFYAWGRPRIFCAQFDPNK